MEFDKVEMAKQILREAGYYVDNLWHIDDVKEEFECSDEDAQMVLNNVLTHDNLVMRINEMIREQGEQSTL